MFKHCKVNTLWRPERSYASSNPHSLSLSTNCCMIQLEKESCNVCLQRPLDLGATIHMPNLHMRQTLRTCAKNSNFQSFTSTLQQQTAQYQYFQITFSPSILRGNQGFRLRIFLTLQSNYINFGKYSTNADINH